MFLHVLLGIIDFGRMLFTWNAANEATRAGARYAVVCDNTANAARCSRKMQATAAANHRPSTSPGTRRLHADHLRSACASRITGMNYNFIVAPSRVSRRLARSRCPRFSTYLTREVMRQDPNSATICP